MTREKAVELLAPAGSFESMKAAVAAGADAVYMGGSRFGARAYADNPDKDKLLEAIDYVHLHGCRLYMTVNTLFKEKELQELHDYLLPYYEQGVDGVIVQDLGAFMKIREWFPGLPIHASTQMTVTGVYGAKVLKNLGAQRVVTARELSLEEIQEIHRQVPIEIESFVHGALCYCYSGQCLMSSLIGGRSGNRGRCAQPCRLPYEIKKNTSYLLNLKDLCTLDLIPDIIEAGVYSMKIEGRMKSPRYTAGVVSIYRKYVDMYKSLGREGFRVDPEDKKLLLDLFDRGGFSKGYYEDHNGRHMVALKEKPAFREGNQNLFDRLDRDYVNAVVQEMVIGSVFLEEGRPSGLSLSLENPGLEPVAVTVTGQMPQRAQNQPVTEEKVAKQIGKTGGTPFLFSRLDVRITGRVFLPVQALNELRRAGLEALEKEILKPYRRDRAAKALPDSRKIRLSEAGGQRPEVRQTESDGQQWSPAFRLSFEEPSQLAAVLSWPELGEYAAQTKGKALAPVIDEIAMDSTGFPAGQWQEWVRQVHDKGISCLLILPHIFRTEAMEYLGTNLKQLKSAGFDGIIVRAMEETEWLKETGITCPMIFDDTMYTWNGGAAFAMKAMGAKRITLPLELTNKELMEISRTDPPSDLVVYGRLPMMVSAQCIKKTTSGCDKRREAINMKDRTGKLLPVKNHCRFCYNTIYNPSPLLLFDCKNEISALKPDGLRMKFTIETEEETIRILKAFLEEGKKKEVLPVLLKDFTRGHFRRGVE